MLASLPPFGFLHDYVTFCSQRTEANIGFHVAGGLIALSQAIPWNLALPLGAPLHANFYALAVGDSSTSMKTTSITQSRLIVQSCRSDQVGEQPGSQEGLFESIRKQAQQVIYYPEFGDFLAKTKDGYGQPLRMSFTAAYDNEPMGRALSKTQKGNIQNPRLSLFGGVAPKLLEDFTNETDWVGGFLARFYTIFAAPERQFPGMPMDDAQGRAYIEYLYKELCKHPTYGLNPPRCGDASIPINGWLTPQARVIWAAFNEEMRVTRQSVNPIVAAHCARAMAMASKIALLLAWDLGPARLAKEGEIWFIDHEIATYAIRLARLHLQSVAILGNRIVNTQDMRDRRRVLDAIDTVRPTALGEITQRAQLLRDRAMKILETLDLEGCVRRVKTMGPWRHDATSGLSVQEDVTGWIRVVQQFANAVPENANIVQLRPQYAPALLPAPPEGSALARSGSTPGTPNFVDDTEIDWATFNP